MAGAALVLVYLSPVLSAQQTQKTTPTRTQSTTPTRTQATTPTKVTSTTPTRTQSTTPTKTTPTRSSLAASRAQAAARARAAAQARQQRELQDLMTARFQRDALGNLVPDVRAAAAIIYNPQTGEVLWEQNSRAERSIASITKVMTAVTFVADDPDLSQKVAVTRADMRNASTTYLAAGQVLTYGDLLHLTLIASDNAAARVLARTSEGGTEAFIARMNQTAVQLGLTNTHYTDPSGLDANNVSSAYDLSHLISFAVSDPRLGPIMRTQEYSVSTNFGPINIHSTDKLLGTEVDVRGAKTGFISKAGYCFASLLQVPQGMQVAVVVLGAANSATRFWEARHLFNWVVGRTQGVVGGAPDKHNQ